MNLLIYLVTLNMMVMDIFSVLSESLAYNLFNPDVTCMCTEENPLNYLNTPRIVKITLQPFY